MSNIVNATPENFESVVLNSDLPVMVDFWAEWCGPCKMILPVLEELNADSEVTDKVTIVKVNADDAADLPAKYGVRGIPTLLMFKDGKPVDQNVGAASKAQIKAFIEKNV